MKAKQMLGSNRTGAKLAPERTREMIAGSLEFPPSSPGDAELIGRVRATYANGEPIGTMPPPPNLKGAAKTVVNAVTGGAPLQLLDKLGERLAFERSGTRLWQAMVAKYDAVGSFSGGPSREDLEHICDEEHRHFTMLRELMEKLDGDPTAVTPAANVQAVASMGLPQVLTDPRTSMVQSLEAVLVAELADNECWPPLLELLVNGGYEDDAQRLLCAVKSEREHLEHVRTWLASAQGRSIGDVEKLTAAETETVLASSALAPLAARESAGAGGDAEDEDADGAEFLPSRRRTQPPRAAGRSKAGSAGAARGRSAGGKRASGAKARSAKGTQKRKSR
jgi:hypothetical protein